MGRYGENWTVDLDDRQVFVIDAAGNAVALVFSQGEVGDVARAERIVACVNALAGRKPEELDALLQGVKNLLGCDLSTIAPHELRGALDVLACTYHRFVATPEEEKP